jgi:hypothetical protein
MGGGTFALQNLAMLAAMAFGLLMSFIPSGKRVPASSGGKFLKKPNTAPAKTNEK